MLETIYLMPNDTTPTKTLMIIVEEITPSTNPKTYHYVYVGDINNLPSDILTESDIINDLVSGGSDKVLSAEMGKELGEELYGKPDYNESIHIDAVSGETISYGTLYPISKLEVGKTYTLTLLTSVLNSLTVYFRGLNDSTANCTINGNTYSNYSIIPANTNQIDITPLVEVVGLKFYSSSANVTGTGDVNISITRESDDRGILGELTDAIEGVNVGNVASLALAFAAVPNRFKKAGLTITYYDTTASEWVAKQYVGTDLSGWNTESNWEDVSPSKMLKQSDIADNLNTDDVTKVLSAKQGKKLGEELYGIEPAVSEAKIHIKPGDSTSSLTLYPFNKPIISGKEYEMKIIIQNGAINQGTLYLKNQEGSSQNFTYTGGNTSTGLKPSSYYFVFKVAETTGDLTVNADVYNASFSLTDANIVAEGDIIVRVTEKNSGKRGLIGDVAELQEGVTDLQGDVNDLQEQIGNITPNNAKIANEGTLSKEIIKLNKSYYFSAGWSSNDNKGYLDEIINSLPEGKHFLLYTDIHLDYDSAFSLAQNQPLVMKYVQDRLGCKTIFCGDIIGSRPTADEAEKEILFFTNNNYALFGSNFISVLGDHDTDRVTGGLEQGDQLTEQFLYDSVFKWSHLYGAVQDTIGIDAIDNVSSFSSEKKDAWKNYMKMHYYADDVANKVRFIVMQQGAKFRFITDVNAAVTELPFVSQSILSAPDDYDIVVVCHEFYAHNNLAQVWCTELGKILSAFKNHSTYTMITSPQQTGADGLAAFAAVSAEYPSAFNYSQKTGNVVMLQGDEHYDYACYYNGSTNATSDVSGTPSTNDILRIVFDRACLVQNPGFPTYEYNDNEQYTNIAFMLKCRRAPAQVGSTVLIGTTSEVLFDIITITGDQIVLTRVGDKPTAGKVGAYPVFSSESSYNTDDIVIWYEDKTINSMNYHIIKAYKFITTHSVGSWNAGEVEEYLVEEPYVRTYNMR